MKEKGAEQTGSFLAPSQAQAVRFLWFQSPGISHAEASQSWLPKSFLGMICQTPNCLNPYIQTRPLLQETDCVEIRRAGELN